MKTTSLALILAFTILSGPAAIAQAPPAATLVQTPAPAQGASCDAQALQDIQTKLLALQTQISNMEKKIDSLHTMLAPKILRRP